MITKHHLYGEIREFNSEPVSEPPDFDIPLCDFCQAKIQKLKPMQVLDSGMRQLTCPKCHSTFIPHEKEEEEER
ncbi:hypothetical protein ACFL02_08350 [Planctomycetota bacterium]